jgi:hypothetical protein
MELLYGGVCGAEFVEQSQTCPKEVLGVESFEKKNCFPYPTVFYISCAF